ncbi:hypothetical protein [Thermogutta sp.]|uniref:hypothetical protein n=1 Tax=Thermogutta sp. TaxID=1962930 RepID=UPI003C7C0E67
MRVPLLIINFVVMGLILRVAEARQGTLADTTRDGPERELGIRPWPVEDRFKNPWPEDWENDWRARARFILTSQAAIKIDRINTFFENEKRTYGYLMAQVLAGNADALKLLQQEDVQAKTWHQHTAGIDYFACFTLKHQIRKYFYFGHLLDPTYKKRMFDGAKLWTEQDPMHRPHPAFKGLGPGYTPEVVNSWVDTRNTENLFLMRETSVYLMAEETGNYETRQLYKDHLLTYAKSLYRVGMGEWDSENYLGHSIAPLLNLYDFAKDPEVKMAAKLALDYIMTAGALKYYRGAFNGPSKRDYNHPQPFGGSAAAMLWVYFGDTPTMNTRWESDEVHILTSSYRPPAAVVKLARKQFDRPTEVFASKAAYHAPQRGDWKTPPENLETLYFGHTFQVGSLVGGTQEPDVNGFKVLVWDEERGAVALQCVPGPDPQFVGSPQYQPGKLAGPNRVAQNRNLLVWLVNRGDAPWLWVIPQAIKVETSGGVTFFRARRTWIAIHPLNLEPFTPSQEMTLRLTAPPADKSLWAGHQVVTATGKGGNYCGFALEIGEEQTHGNYEAFKRAILSKAKVSVAELNDGVAGYTGSDGHTVQLAFGLTPADTKIWRDGTLHDLAEHAQFVYREAGKGEDGLVYLRWGGGTLHVNAGGAQFVATIDETGKASFRNE